MTPNPILHVQPTKQEVHERCIVLGRKENADLLHRVSRSLVRGTADREELQSDIIMALVEAPTLSPGAEAVGLLSTPDGSLCRGKAYTIIHNMGRTLARKLITVRDREVSIDPHEQARRDGALKSDGTWHRLDKDDAKRHVNTTNGDDSPVEFKRRSERISENTVLESRLFDAKGRIEMVREQRLETMLRQALRVHDLHDEGRLDRVDRLALTLWHERFITTVPHPTSPFVESVNTAVGQLTKHRTQQVAALMLILSGHHRSAPRFRATVAQGQALMAFLTGETHKVAREQQERKQRQQERDGIARLMAFLTGRQPRPETSDVLMTGHRRMMDKHGTWVAFEPAGPSGWVVSDAGSASVAAIADGHITSIGALVVACTSATQERSRDASDVIERTEEYMKVHWSTFLQLIGLDSTTANVRAAKKLVQRMAKDAGASGKPLLAEGRYNVLERLRVKV